MGTIKLTKSEIELVSRVEHGEKAEFKGKQPRISAEVLRHIVLGLPLIRTGAEASSSEVSCIVTGAGVSIRNAIISGALNLDGAIGRHGGPLCALEFRNCTFRGRFSGAHAHFSRLSFRGCCFVDRANGSRPRPTIHLSGAKLDRQLDMEGIRPAEPDTGLLWIRAPEIEVGGSLILSGCRLRSSADPIGTGKRKERGDALDLNSAAIGADLFIEGGVVDGRFTLRGGKIRGDMRFQGARFENPDGKAAMLIQATHVGGFAILRADGEGRGFRCNGNLFLTASEICRSLVVMAAEVTGTIDGPDLIVRDDFFLHARVGGDVDLEHMTIGGSLDIANLRMIGRGADGRASRKPRTLCLKDGRIGRELRLVPEERHRSARFKFTGIVDLSGLSCETLDDEVGLKWGNKAQVRMHHFSYNRTGWLNEAKKPSHVMLWHWLLAKWAEGHRPLRWLGKPRRLRKDDYWQPWQLRRNWIHQQFDTISRDPVSLARHRISERHYHPQPFEQAIRVARAEGRDDFATRFEMLKQRIEWGHFNWLVSWWLGFAGIALGTLWLVLHQPPAGKAFDRDLLAATMLALAVSLFLMVRSTSVHIFLRSIWPALSLGFAQLRGGRASPADPDAPRIVPTEPRRRHRYGTWFVYFLPVLALFLLSGWKNHPFHFLVAFLIFLCVRFIAEFAHGAMRLGFGYLRRPVRAIVTLILAFLAGWLGVEVAARHDMLVVAAEPVAGLVGPHDPRALTKSLEGEKLMGSESTTGPARFIRDIRCDLELSRPLYALDILIPLVDLREESRCEVRRVAALGSQWPPVERMGIWELVEKLPDMTVRNHRFWWLMKALYAIAGWFIVSLAILTFAQANRARGDPA